MLRQFGKFNFLNNYNFNVFCGLTNFHKTTQRFVEEETKLMENNPTSKIYSMLSKYDREQEEKMLKIVNNCSLNELLGYEISKARANKLLSWRQRYGLLKSLDDVFSIQGFGVKVTEKFFKSLLLEPKTNKENLSKGQKRTSSFITPTLEAEQRKTIKSTVSVRTSVKSVTWCRLEIPCEDVNSPCLLTHWQHYEISEKKLHINELIQRCLYFNYLIPAADCYLFENPQVAQTSNNPGSAEQQNINIQKSQVTAMLGYALTSRNHKLYKGTNNETSLTYATDNLPNVFYIRRFLAARLFNHFVGTERVSSEDTILNMMRTFYNTDEMQDTLPKQIPSAAVQSCDNNETFSRHVQFPMELRDMFSKAPRYYREFLGQSLLLNLAFVRLVLLQDAKSIAIVSRGGSSD